MVDEEDYVVKFENDFILYDKGMVLHVFVFF